MDVGEPSGLDEHYDTHKGRLHSIKKIEQRVAVLFVGSCKKI